MITTYFDINHTRNLIEKLKDAFLNEKAFDLYGQKVYILRHDMEIEYATLGVKSFKHRFETNNGSTIILRA